MTDRLINVKEMAQILNVPVSWIYDRTRQGPEVIPHVKLGAYVRFNPEEVINFYRNKSNERWQIGMKRHVK